MEMILAAPWLRVGLVGRPNGLAHLWRQQSLGPPAEGGHFLAIPNNS